MRQLYKTPELLEDGKYLRDILDKLVIEKMQPHGTHETLALKCHYFSCIIEQAMKADSTNKDKGKAFIKK